MINRQLKKLTRWRKLPKDEYYKAEAFLKVREKFCVAASARFLNIKKSSGHIWYLGDTKEDITALLLHSRRSLFPVFDKNPNIIIPHFLKRFLLKIPIHAVQGLREDTEILESLMENQGYYAVERIDYDLMSIDNSSKPEILNSGPLGLILREPVAGDEESIFALQSAYEQEEVLPKNAVFDAVVCRFNLEHILSSEYILVAELDGQIVGKINTSAESFTRFQIGGVYVRPDCRSRGIAVKMTAKFIQNLLAMGKGITLFVKRKNNAARKVYIKTGLRVLAEYRITYY